MISPHLTSRNAAPDRRAVVRVSLLLTAVALVLYAPGLGWGLPHVTAPERVFAWGSDEVAPLGPLAQTAAFALHADVQFDPRYPLLAFAIQAAFMLPYLAWLWLSGGLQGFVTAYPFGLADPVGSLATMTLLARLSSLLMLASLPAIAYWTAFQLFGRRAAMPTALFVLTLFPVFFYSRTSNVDGAALFFIALGLLLYAMLLRGPASTRRVVLLGICAALATAAKDHSYAMFGAIALVVFIRAARRPAGAPSPVALGTVFGFGLAAAVVTYALTSGLALNPRLFFEHVDFIVHTGPRWGQLPATLAGHLQLLVEFFGHLRGALGLPVALAAAGGVVLLFRRDRTALLFLIPAVALLAGVIVPSRFVLFRFVMPVAYVMTFFAGALVASWRTPDLAGRRLPGWNSAAVVFLVVAVGWSLLRGLDLTYQMLFDSRYQLAAWVRTNLQDGDRLGYYGANVKLPALDATVAAVPGPYSVGSETEPPRWPEFLVLIPQQPQEIEHEDQLPADRYEELRRGEWPYRLVYASRTRAIFPRQPITWVNPPIRLYARRDVFSRIPASAIRLELDRLPSDTVCGSLPVGARRTAAGC